VERAAIDPDAFNAFEAAGWEERAPGYDRFFGSITRRLAEPLLDAASVKTGTRVLDIASGPGYVANEAAERGASVIGGDVAPAMIAVARQLHPGIDFREADAHALPFALTAWDIPERARFLGVFLAAFAEAGATPPEDLPVGPPIFRFSADDEFDGLFR
jgi:SAM-dependent methyltransferase